MCLGYIYISVYNLLLSFALGCMVLGLSSRASVLPSLHSFRNCLDVVYWSLPCLCCFLLPTCPVAPFLSVEQVFFVAAASCRSCACWGCVGLVTGVVSILLPQFGSEWGCRCYTSCWCSYGFHLHLFLCCGFSGILFLGKVPFSTCCFRRCAVVGFRPLPFLLVCVCTLLCLCVTYLSLYVLVCILYIYWYFSFLLSGPLFLCSLEFWVLGLLYSCWFPEYGLFPLFYFLLPDSPRLVRVVSRVGVWVGLVSVVVPVMGGEHFISRLCCGCFTFLPFLSSILACLALHIKFHFHWGRFVPCWFGWNTLRSLSWFCVTCPPLEDMGDGDIAVFRPLREVVGCHWSGGYNAG